MDARCRPRALLGRRRGCSSVEAAVDRTAYCQPVGEAEVSLTLRWAKTLCDLDPSIGCAKNPFATVDVVD